MNFTKEIGKGNFSNVFLISNNKNCAVKRMDIEYREYAYSEIDVLKNIDHKNIIKLEDYKEDDKYIYIILEYFKGEILSYYSHNKKKIIIEIGKTLVYLHNKNYIHGDLSLDNILADKDGNIKVIDFGLSKIKRQGQLKFCAPETLLLNEKNDKTDIWAYGIICFFLLTGDYPYKASDSETMLIKIKNQKIEYSLDKTMKKFIKCLLNRNPTKRKINISLIEI